MGLAVGLAGMGTVAAQVPSPPEGAGMPGPWGGAPPGDGPGAGGVQLDPMVAAESAARPLIAKRLAVPALLTRYLQYVHQMDEHWLDWDNVLGQIALAYRDLIDVEAHANTRKLDSYKEFRDGIAGAPLAARRRPGACRRSRCSAGRTS